MRNGFSIFILAVTLVKGAHSQQVAFDLGNLSDALNRTKSTDLHTREAAFDELMADLTDDARTPMPTPNKGEVLKGFFPRHPAQAAPV